MIYRSALFSIIYGYAEDVEIEEGICCVCDKNGEKTHIGKDAQYPLCSTHYMSALVLESISRRNFEDLDYLHIEGYASPIKCCICAETTTADNYMDTPLTYDSDEGRIFICSDCNLFLNEFDNIDWGVTTYCNDCEKAILVDYQMLERINEIELETQNNNLLLGYKILCKNCRIDTYGKTIRVTTFQCYNKGCASKTKEIDFFLYPPACTCELVHHYSNNTYVIIEERENYVNYILMKDLKREFIVQGKTKEEAYLRLLRMLSLT